MIPIEELLADHQLYHSEFQQDRFITIKSGGTPYGCYKQALRELSKRHQAIQELELQIEEAEIELDELRPLIVQIEGKESASAEDRRLIVDHKRKSLTLKNLDLTMRETQREYGRFLQQARGLKAHLGEITPERRDELDREMWEYRVKSLLAVELFAYGRPSTSTIELLQCLPPGMRARILPCLETPDTVKKLQADYLNEESAVEGLLA